MLGGNLGNREKTFSLARDMIREEIGGIIKMSSIYETEAWGFNSDQTFLNQVVLINTKYSAPDTLTVLLKIEKRLGRKRTSVNYESREIDLDMLFYNDDVINLDQLQVPHPRLHLRRFTLIPLNEIASQEMHPILNKKINMLMENCSDNSKVNLFKPMNQHGREIL